MAQDEVMKVWVVGASNVDITARSDKPIVDTDSNIGTVEKSPGGVGRNIAFALRALGFDVSMLTALADDEYGHMIADGMKKAGIRLAASPFAGPDYRTGVYCCIMDGDGSLVCAVNDMKINSNLTPEFVMEYKKDLEGADYVVFEANLPVETIRALAGLDVKLVADCVSGAKARKLSEVLEHIYLLKANYLEACALAGVEVREPDGEVLQEVMEALVAKGLRRAIISLGRKGAFCYELSGTGTRGVDAPVLDGLNVVSTNGCGDVLLAGFLRALAEGLPIDDALFFGQAASGINSESMEAVSPALSFENVRKKAEERYEQIS